MGTKKGHKRVLYAHGQDQRLAKVVGLINKGKHSDALVQLELIHAERPDDLQVMYLKANVLFKQGQNALALELLKEILERDSKHFHAHMLAGDILLHAGDSEGAADEYQHALDCDADNPNALASLGGLMLKQSQHIRDAVEMLEKAVSIAPSNDWTRIRLAEACLQVGRAEEAIRHGEKAVKTSPSRDNCQILGKIYQSIGDKEAACKWYGSAMRKNPLDGFPYYRLIKNRCASMEDGKVIRKMKNALNESISIESRIAFLFAIAEIYNRMGQWDDAFEYYEKGNTLYWRGHAQNSSKRIYSQSRKIVNKSFLDERKMWGVDKGVVPIFIVGMPRSGSTLIDQILSSHSRVESVGESSYLDNILNRLAQKKGEIYPKLLNKLDRDEFTAIGDEYLSMMLDSVNGKPEFIVDKQLFNHMYLDLISIIFPNAKIIHACRNPIDTCLSCYFQLFGERISLAWSCDLKSTGERYCVYKNTMKHWKEVLTMPIFDVNYEDVVMNFDATVRHLLKFCSLSWEPQLEHFYKKEGIVATASYDQVRQPLYRGSIGRWEPYAKHIVPLLQSVAPALEEADREALRKHGVDIRKPNIFSRLFG